MPIVPFHGLPENARVWIFASDRPLGETQTDLLLAEVDRYLAGWQAHGAPLHCARQWRADRFLAVGVDPTTANASGCSIDGLFRALQALEPLIGSRLVGGGRVFYRDSTGAARSVARDEFGELVDQGAVTRDTTVFDTTVSSVLAWKERFERPAGDAWTATFFADA
jgi:hypothetical protein